MEEDRMDELKIKPWQGKNNIFINITGFFMFWFMAVRYICFIPAESRKIKQKRMIAR